MLVDEVRGKQLILALGEHFRFQKVFTHEAGEELPYNAAKIVRTSEDVLKHALFGPGREEYIKIREKDDFIVGVIQQPQPIGQFHGDPKWLLALDGIRHPENMGLLLSTAVALKFDGVLLTKTCVDPFNYKVLEASQAVAWTLPYRYTTSTELLEICARYKLEPCAADPRGEPLDHLPVLGKERRGFCLAVGNEARGVDPALLIKCTKVGLPMSELMNSLNAGVAGGILMHALACAWGH